MPRGILCLALIALLGGGGAIHAGLTSAPAPGAGEPDFMGLIRRPAPVGLAPGATDPDPTRTPPVRSGAPLDLEALETEDFETLLEATLELQDESLRASPSPAPELLEEPELELDLGGPGARQSDPLDGGPIARETE